ncbi:DegT/DnrJ/EryC1/StrS aminotransferase [Desulfarculus baarsii DSM 2075]|uniref:DegT/DnrJ/EryC1/StrS aminotransferase n=1 Tax=Desulfarculus baarsii (strain ATCC 33931 / DSM 2075 / LMG 7858 / VKM B-1802 / 2st14) TaxID=644282 RepID=E1QIZ2_DESB2|nr:aminotransferase class I/II-fold pyridoxal phosphate-dependent enzyme [Desulfarculus baarsii]ADK85535.1 DegT/DnrJ/EryC1/StrS aminotransferase [Desulfarculus baarsii DSM 2075]
MKRRLEDLAIFGGPRLFESFRPTGQLSLPDSRVFFKHARTIFDQRRLTNNGPLVRMLEERLALLHQSAHCVSFCNASVAIVLLLRLLGGDDGGNVLMPTFTYPGLPHIALWAGFKPVFCDVDQHTHAIDVASVAANLTPRSVVILAVHQVQSPCQIDELTTLARQRGVALLFDSVHGLGCTHRGKPIGGFGAAEVFSLHATKLLNGFEGGYVTTNDDALAAELRSARSFGFQGKDNVVRLGLNGKLNEIHAALALAALDDLEQTIQANRARHEAYRRLFADLPGLNILEYATNERHNYELTIFEMTTAWPLSRDDTLRLLNAENALARPYYSPPLHHSEHCPPGCGDVSLPVAEALATRFIQMPVGDLVSLADIEALAELMTFVGANGPTVAARLARDGRPS